MATKLTEPNGISPNRLSELYEQLEAEKKSLLKELEETSSVSVEKTSTIIKNHIGFVSQILHPAIGVKYSMGRTYFGTDSRRCGFVVRGRPRRVKKLKIAARDYSSWYYNLKSEWLVVSDRRGRPCVKIKKGSIPFKRGLRGFSSAIANEDCYRTETVLSNITKSAVLALKTLFERQSGSISGKIDDYKKKLQEIPSVIRKREEELSSYIRDKFDLPDPNLPVSLDDVIEKDLLPKISSSELCDRLVPLFYRRDSRVPVVLKSLDGEDADSFLLLSRRLEAEMQKIISNCTGLDETREYFSYFAKCGLPVKELKQGVLRKVRGEEAERRKRVDGLLGEIEEV